MKPTEEDDCVRKRCTIKGQNCYVITGSDFVMIVLPYENRPEMRELREIMETVSETVTEGMADLRKRDPVRPAK